MARLIISGWETGSANEWTDGLTATVTGDNIAAVTSPVRTGNYSLRVDYSTTASTSGRVTQMVTGIPATNTMFVRFYLYITSIPTERSAVFRTSSAAGTIGARGSVSINTDGSVQIYNGSTAVGSASPTLSTSTWYRIEVSTKADQTNQTITLKVDGVTIANAVSFANTNLDNVVQVGWSATGTAGPTKAGTYYLDDYMLVYDAGGGLLTFPGEGRVLMLLPVADSAVGTGWTLGTGTAISSNGFESVNNVPPLGVVDLAAGSNPNQIRNAASAANSNFDVQVTDYATAGIATGDTITFVQPTTIMGAAASTSPKSGTHRVVSNPAGAASVSNSFYQGTSAAGTYPTGWICQLQFQSSVEGDIASGNRNTRPVVRITQVTSSARIAMVCFLGLYVDYIQAAPAALVWKPASGPNYRR